MRNRVPLSIIFGTALALSAGAPPSPAQQPEAPRDSVARDSLAGDSVPDDSARMAPVHAHGMIAIIPVAAAAAVGAIGVLGLAPAAYAFYPRRASHPAIAFLADHRTASLSIGGVFSDGESWSNSAHLEVMRAPFIAELALEDFQRPERVQHLTLRAGYLVSPQRGTAGGVTLGYRHAPHGWLQGGLEVGLPFFIGNSLHTGRFEPTYVLSRHGALWSYRMQYERRLPGPYVAGLRVVGKTVPINEGHPLHDEEPRRYFVRGAALVVGSRF